MDRERRLYDEASRNDGVFTYQDARQARLTRGVIDDRRARLWKHIYVGVFLAPGAPETPRALIRAACLAGAPHAAASHRAAAALYDVPGGDPRIAEVTCPRWLRANHPKLIVHESKRIDAADVRFVDGIPVMRPERVLIELAAIYKSADFIEKVLHAMRRKKLVTHDSVVDVFNGLAKRGRPGIATTRTVLDRWDPTLKPAESPPELDLIHLLEEAAFGRVMPQFEIRDRAGVFIARVDAGLPDFRVVVEYESDQEHSDEMSLARDNMRRNRLMAEGWFVVAARKPDLKSGGGQVVAAVRALVELALRNQA
jgi:hypothetical protein